MKKSQTPDIGCLRFFVYTSKPLVLCGIIKGTNYIPPRRNCMKTSSILDAYRTWLTHREYSPATIQKYTKALA